MEKEELNGCLRMFYAALRREDGTEFKVSSLKAIRAAIDRYLRQPLNNKPWSIVGDWAFQKSNKVLNAICKQMMQEGKVGPMIHKNPITSEQLQQLYETGKLCVSYCDEDITHVLFPRRVDYQAGLRSLKSTPVKTVQLVSIHWLPACIAERKVIPTRHFEVK